MLPPPPPLSKNFYQRFLQGKQDTVAAVQVILNLSLVLSYELYFKIHYAGVTKAALEP